MSAKAGVSKELCWKTIKLKIRRLNIQIFASNLTHHINPQMQVPSNSIYVGDLDQTISKVFTTYLSPGAMGGRSKWRLAN